MQVWGSDAREQVEKIAWVVLAHLLAGSQPESQQRADPLAQFFGRGTAARDGAGPAADQGLREIAVRGHQYQVARTGAEAFGPDARIDGSQQVDQPTRLFSQCGVGSRADAVAHRCFVDRFRQGDLDAGLAEQRTLEPEQRLGLRLQTPAQRRTRQLQQHRLRGQAHFLAAVVERGLEEGFVLRPEADRQAGQQP